MNLKKNKIKIKMMLNKKHIGKKHIVKIIDNNINNLYPPFLIYNCVCGNVKLHNLKCSIYYCRNCGNSYVKKNKKITEYKMWIDKHP